jgi:NAD(P)-dependent dehydrogenase (short-subunit alcohol dehydrogenase family)
MTPPSANGAVLITGCSSGIGKATALALAAAGFTVWAGLRRPEGFAALEAAGCRPLLLDVCDESSMQAAVQAVQAEQGHIDVLVNNAGFGQHGALEETPLEALRRQFEVNAFGPLRLCQLVLPGMRRAGAGRIVNVSSMGGRLGFPGGGAYHGSKYALEAFSDALRWEVAGFGIGVTVIEPGPTLSAFGDAALDSLAHLRETGSPYAALNASIRAGLEGTFHGEGLAGASTPQDVAQAILQALRTDPAPTRVVVGEMARQLIALRAGGSDEAWDAMLDTMYRRPGVAEGAA